MKKPIEEVMEKASKGPFTVKNNTPSKTTNMLCSPTFSNWPIATDILDKDAALIAHCLNNFGPMLEALKKAEDDMRLCANCQSETYDAVCEAIESASTVEVTE